LQELFREYGDPLAEAGVCGLVARLLLDAVTPSGLICIDLLHSYGIDGHFESFNSMIFNDLATYLSRMVM